MGLCETFRRLGRFATGLALLISLIGFGPAAARAYDNPDLLPDHPTPVIDLAKALTDGQRTSLESNLNAFEASSGWKLRWP